MNLLSRITRSIIGGAAKKDKGNNIFEHTPASKDESQEICLLVAHVPLTH